MPNQLNFGNQIVDFVGERMVRLPITEHTALSSGEKTVLFGTDEHNNIELWFYFPDGTFAGSIRLSIHDPDIQLSTVVDLNGVFEFVNLNLAKITERVPLEPSRYTVSVYFFRDEVGTKDSNENLIIKEISPSRTEVRLHPLEVNDAVIKEILEFAIPSTTRLHAKGLTDQIFGKSIGGLEMGEFISSTFDLNNPSGSVIHMLELNKDNVLGSDLVSSRIVRSQSVLSYEQLVSEIIDRTYFHTLKNFASDYSNLNVQKHDLRDYVELALETSLEEILSEERLDPRFVFSEGE